jgi:hypothetical protein
MITLEIIQEINKIEIASLHDGKSIDKIHLLTDMLRDNDNGYLACEALISLLERHPSIEFGSPGEPVHTLETYDGHYQKYLYASLERRPTYMTIWMLNRIINDTSNLDSRQQLMIKLKNCSVHNKADNWAKESALGFYKFQGS